MISNDYSATDTFLATTGSFVAVPCPACGGTLVRRSHRNGLAEAMFSVVYVYPFRCQLCTHRFLALQWGVRYQRRDRRREEGRQSPAGQFFSLR